MILAASLISNCAGFIGRHPGLLFVLLGVIGEVIFDWKEMGTGRLAAAKRLSAVILVFGLLIEFWEATKSDEQVAKLGVQAADSNLEAKQAEKDAEQANERAAKFDADRVMVEKEAEEIRSTNFVLQARVLELEGALKPRIITKEEHDDFVSSLKNAPKNPVWVISNNPNAETMSLLSQIREMLDDAGYSGNSLDPESLAGSFGPAVSGKGTGVYSSLSFEINNPNKSTVLLFFSSLDVSSNLPEYGKALWKSFEKIHIKVSGANGGKHIPSGEVDVFVTGKDGF